MLELRHWGSQPVSPNPKAAGHHTAQGETFMALDRSAGGGGGGRGGRT